MADLARQRTSSVRASLTLPNDVDVPQRRRRTEAEAAAPASKPLASASVLLAWCLCSGARMFLNKAVYQSGYRYPFAVTGLSQTFALACAWLLVQARAFPYQRWSNWRQYAKVALPAAGASVATLYTGNVGVMLLPVTFVQIVKGLTPSITLLLAAMVGSERLTAPLVATVGAISAGSALSCLQQGQLPGFSWIGFMFQVWHFVPQAHVSVVLLELPRASATYGLAMLQPWCCSCLCCYALNSEK